MSDPSDIPMAGSADVPIDEQEDDENSNNGTESSSSLPPLPPSTNGVQARISALERQSGSRRLSMNDDGDIPAVQRGSQAFGQLSSTADSTADDGDASADQESLDRVTTVDSQDASNAASSIGTASPDEFDIAQAKTPVQVEEQTPLEVTARMQRDGEEQSTTSAISQLTNEFAKQTPRKKLDQEELIRLNPNLDDTEIARIDSEDQDEETDSLPSEGDYSSVKQTPTDEDDSAFTDLPNTGPASSERISESSVSTSTSGKTMGGSTFEKMRMPTPNVFDDAAATNEAVQQQDEWMEQAIQAPSTDAAVVPVAAANVAAPQDDVTNSTKTNGDDAFDIAMSQSGDSEPPSLSKSDHAGGPLWDSTRPPPVPAVAQAAQPNQPVSDEVCVTTSTISTGTNAFDVALSQSTDYQSPSNAGDGGRLWQEAQPPPVPAVAQASHPAPTPVASDATTSISTSGPNAFDIAVSQPSVHQTPPPSEVGGRMWHEARPPPIPAVAQTSHPTTSQAAPDDVTISTVTTGTNAFDAAMSQSTPDQVRSYHTELGSGGPMWQEAKPAPVPAVAQFPRPTSEQVASDDVTNSTSTGTDAFDIAKSQSTDYQSPPASELGDGGRMWTEARPPPVPVVAQAPRTAPDTTQPGLDESTTVTNSTGPNAFDVALSQLVDYEPSSSGGDGGGRLWHEAEPAPIAALTPAIRVHAAPEDVSTNATTSETGIDAACTEPSRYQPPSLEDEDGTGDDDMSQLPAVSQLVQALEENKGANARPPPHPSSPRTSPSRLSSSRLSPGRLSPSRPPLQAQRQSSVTSTSTTTTMNAQVFERLRAETPESVSTVGGAVFERLQAPTPDAFDVAISKSEESGTSDEDEIGGPLWDIAATTSEEGIVSMPSDEASDRYRLPDDDDDDDDNHTQHSIVESVVSAKRRDGENESYRFRITQIVRTRKQRRRLAELLVVASCVTTFGFLGNFFVGVSCYFVSAPIEVGQYSTEIDLHYGLWKYSEAESALIGFPFCNSYTQSPHQDDAPLLPRIFHALAMAAGTFGLGILWFYLFSGVAVRNFWTLSIWFSALAAVFQSLTLLFFIEPMCRENDCDWGPAASVVLLATFCWIVLALEMRHQMSYVCGIPTNGSAQEGKGKGQNKKDGNSIEMASVGRTEELSSGDYEPPKITGEI